MIKITAPTEDIRVRAETVRSEIPLLIHSVLAQHVPAVREMLNLNEALSLSLGHPEADRTWWLVLADRVEDDGHSRVASAMRSYERLWRTCADYRLWLDAEVWLRQYNRDGLPTTLAQLLTVLSEAKVN